MRLQLLLHAIATTGSAPVAASYRQLTGGRLLATERAVLAVRVQRAEGWSDEDLERALSGAVRKVRAKLGGVPHRPLGEVAALRVLGEFAGHDGTQPAQEGWAALHVGGLLQTTYRGGALATVAPRPGPRAAAAAAAAARHHGLRLADRRALPRSGEAGAPTDQMPAQLTVRVAAPDQASLGNAGTALRQVLATDHANARRLDGEQMDGLLATLPLAGPTPAGLARPVTGAPAAHRPRSPR